MFRKKPKQEKGILSDEEIERLKQRVNTPKTKPVQIASQPVPVPTVSGKESRYFIGRRDKIRGKKTIETKSGQIIELPEESIRTVIKEVYNLTQQDLITILKGVDETKPFSEIVLKMLVNEL